MSYHNYQQYHQYQNPEQQQQQQQQQPAITITTSHTHGLSWNGASWVQRVDDDRNSTNYYSSAHFQYEQQQSQSQPSSHNNNHQSPVELYTQYYHGWQACLKEYQKRNSNSNQSTNNIDWARYYADESSRAAHYYHEQILLSKYNNNNEWHRIPPPPFDLPPAPPNVQALALALGTPQEEGTSTNSTAALATPQEGTTTTTAAAANTAASTTPTTITTLGSFTQYVQRCLQPCTTPTQRQTVQSQLETVIARAIQDGNFHTRNWSLEPPIIRSSGDSSTTTATVAAAANVPAMVAAPKSFRNNHNHNKSGSGSYYYGPASSSSSSPHPPAISSISYHSDSNYYAPSHYSSSQQASAAPSSSWNDDEDNFVAVPPPVFHNHYHPKKRKTTPLGGGVGLDRSSEAWRKRHARFSAVSPGSSSTADAGRRSKEEDTVVVVVRGNNNGNSGSGDKAATTTTTTVFTEDDYERMTVKGTCEILEKEYFRLTAPPRPELVRPLSILEQHLEQLKQEYYNTTAATTATKKRKRRDYLWFCSQLKAVRQDLTIQRIQNAFAIDVYETHARIALQEGDLNEFNQCQTQLKELYAEVEVAEEAGHPDEFLAYRLLYHVFLTTNDKYKGGTSEITPLLRLLGQQQRRRRRLGPAMAHALQVRQAVALNDYPQFFRLHRATPHWGAQITRHMVPTIRFRALKRITRAYRPDLELRVAVRLLGFTGGVEDGESADIIQQGRDWIQSCGGIVSKDGKLYNTKDSDGIIHEPELEKNSLI